jgi:hypothetical protein
VTTVCDFIRTMEYLCSAAHAIHLAGPDDACRWGADRARMLLEGTDPSQVAAGMRRSATFRGLAERRAADQCARYLRGAGGRPRRPRAERESEALGRKEGLGRQVAALEGRKASSLAEIRVLEETTARRTIVAPVRGRIGELAPRRRRVGARGRQARGRRARGRAACGRGRAARAPLDAPFGP